MHAAVYAEPDHNLGALTLGFGEVLVSHHQLRGMECGETISVYGEAGALHLDHGIHTGPMRFGDSGWSSERARPERQDTGRGAALTPIRSTRL